MIMGAGLTVSETDRGQRTEGSGDNHTNNNSLKMPFLTTHNIELEKFVLYDCL